MQTSIGFSLPRDFVRKVDKAAASVGLNRSELMLQVMRRRVSFNNAAPLVIEPSPVNDRSGNRRVVGFRCSDKFRDDILAAADLLSLDYSIFIFLVLRAYLIEGAKKPRKTRRK